MSVGSPPRLEALLECLELQGRCTELPGLLLALPIGLLTELGLMLPMLLALLLALAGLYVKYAFCCGWELAAS